MDHLYVMQSANGSLKIGRSKDPLSRRRWIQTQSGFLVELAIVLLGQGFKEKAIHEGMEEYRGIGEWFCGTPPARKRLAELLGEEIKFPFPAKKYHPARYKFPRKDGKPRKPMAVTRRLADGSLRTYTYAYSAKCQNADIL